MVGTTARVEREVDGEEWARSQARNIHSPFARRPVKKRAQFLRRPRSDGRLFLPPLYVNSATAHGTNA